MPKTRKFYLDEKDFYIDTPERVEIAILLGRKRVVAKEGKKGEEHGAQITLDDAVMEFSRIRKELDIKSFASKYGLLGINDTADLSDTESYGETFSIDPYSSSERIEDWLFHANRFRKLLKLRKAYNENQPLYKIISNNEWTFCWKEDNIPIPVSFRDIQLTCWYKGQENTLTLSTGRKKIDSSAEDNYMLRKLTPVIFKDEIDPYIRSPLITVDFYDSTDVIFDNPEQRFEGGFNFVLRGKFITQSLLVALYYALFNLVNGAGNIGICDVCGGPVLIKRSRGAGPCYCSTKCKVKKHSKGGKTDG